MKFLLKPLLVFTLLFNFHHEVVAQDSALVANSDSTLVADSDSTPHVNKNRIRWVAIGNIAGYTGSMIGLNSAWYSDYPRSSFHTFDDNAEWLQVDKVGHTYSAYVASRLSFEMWKWAGLPRKKRIWIGGMSGAVYQTVIEVLDGFSAEWGWSWGDFAANVTGSGLFISQELAWDQQRIKLKYSVHNKNYSDPVLQKRSKDYFGSSLGESMFKDYNAQTYWLSANIRSFFPKSKSPRWLSFSLGYGADGMFGARSNVWTDENGTTFSRTDIKRYRQWYLAPDVELMRIRTKSKALKILFGFLDAFKFPTPSLELSNGNFKWNWLHF